MLLIMFCSIRCTADCEIDSNIHTCVLIEKGIESLKLLQITSAVSN